MRHRDRQFHYVAILLLADAGAAAWTSWGLIHFAL